MNYQESISLSAFIMGGFSLMFGIFGSIIMSSSNVNMANAVFYAGTILWMVFWAIAIGVISYSKFSK